MAVLTEAEIPEKNKKRAVAQSSRLKKKRKGVISKAKACKIAEDGSVHGKKLTPKAMRFMRARCGDDD